MPSSGTLWWLLFPAGSTSSSIQSSLHTPALTSTAQRQPAKPTVSRKPRATELDTSSGLTEPESEDEFSPGWVKCYHHVCGIPDSYICKLPPWVSWFLWVYQPVSVSSLLCAVLPVKRAVSFAISQSAGGGRLTLQQSFADYRKLQI